MHIKYTTTPPQEPRQTPKPSGAESGNMLLCVPAGWESYISREFYELHEGLVIQGWTKLIIGEVADEIIITSIRRAQVVLLWEAYEFLERTATTLATDSSLAQRHTKRIVFCDDVHYFTAHRRAQRLRAFCWADLILATYPDKLKQWYPEIEENKVRWSPHAAASCFQATFSPASDRILLSGSRTWPYPFRQFCAAKLSDSICQIVDHPGYPGYPGDKANTMQADPSALSSLGREGYAALLRNYPAMLVCGSVFGYLVAKIFEGMAAGCLVICERESLLKQLSTLGFIEGQHYIGTDLLHVIEDTISVRDAFLRGDPIWKNIVTQAARKVSEQHTTTARATQIHYICAEGITS
jgi:hypothetical protein